VNKRDAKRRVCLIAASLLERWVEAELSDHHDRPLDNIELDEPARELIAELRRRGNSA
jgi:hypothetical protein